MTMTLKPHERRDAINAAQQLVRPALALQSLVAYLEEVAAHDDFIAEKQRLIQAADAERLEHEQAAAAAKTEAASAKQRAEQTFAAATAEEQANLAKLRAQVAAATSQSESLSAQIKDLEARLAGLRSSLAAASSAVA